MNALATRFAESATAPVQLRLSCRVQRRRGRGRHQVFEVVAAGGRRSRTRASTATHPSGRASTGFRSSSATSGMSSASRAEAVKHVGERSAIGRWRAAPAVDELRRLAARDELVDVDLAERCEREPRRADQLGVHAARAERDERPEHRILDRAREQLDAARDVLLDEHRAADGLAGAPHRGLVAQVDVNAARLGLVRSGGGRLDDDREPELGGGCHCRARRRARTARRRAAGRRRSAARAARQARARRRRSPRAPAITIARQRPDRCDRDAAARRPDAAATPPAERRARAPGLPTRGR